MELKKTPKGTLNALNNWFKEQNNAGVPLIQFLVHVHFFAIFNKVRIGKKNEILCCLEEVSHKGYFFEMVKQRMNSEV